MIYLVTVTPAIDEYVMVNDFKVNTTNVSEGVLKYFGGKAINSARIVSQFIDEYELITCCSKENEDFIREQTKGLKTCLIDVEYVRRNLKINNNGQITEINEAAPILNSENEKKIENYLMNVVTEQDYILFAGRIHLDNKEFFLRLMKELKGKIVLDIPNISIEDIKNIEIEMMKPNEEEIHIIVPGEKTIEEKIKKMNKSGVKEVIVSKGGDGFVYHSSNKEICEKAYKGNVINTVGAGDSFIGGYLVGKKLGYTIEKTLSFANACGASTAFSESIGTKEVILKLIDNRG